MIQLKKGTEPEILARNGSEWTKVVLDKLKNRETLTETERKRYNHPQIKKALVEETYGKCAYCESKVRHTSYGDIEHVVPKSVEPSKWFYWPNLTLACEVCNRRKGDAPVAEESFIDPYEVDPEEHYWQLGPTMHPKPGCDAAALTERLLDLNRMELVEKRTERQTALMSLLDSYERCKNPQLKRLLWEEFVAESEARNEFAALSRTILELARRKLKSTDS